MESAPDLDSEYYDSLRRRLLISLVLLTASITSSCAVSRPNAPKVEENQNSVDVQTVQNLCQTTVLQLCLLRFFGLNSHHYHLHGLGIGLISIESCSIHGAQFALGQGVSEGPVNGIQASGFGCTASGDLHGVQSGLFFAHCQNNASGLQLSAGIVGSEKKLKGLQLSGLFAHGGDVDGISAATLVSYLNEVKGFQGSLLLSVADGGLRGLQVAILTATCAGAGGVQGSLLSRSKGGNFDGVQFGALLAGSESPFKGLQLGGLIAAADQGKERIAQVSELHESEGPFEGVQAAGLLARSHGMSGFQGAIVLATNEGQLDGLQMALVSSSNTIRGLQLGGVNTAGETRGLQLGLINSSSSLSGVQIGLINLENGRLQFPLLNF